MLATYMPYEGCWTAFRAVCWQLTSLMRAGGPLLGLYVGNLGLMRAAGPLLWLFAGNLQALSGLLDRFYGCMLATYMHYEGCWTAFMAACWQPTGLIRLLDRF